MLRSWPIRRILLIVCLALLVPAIPFVLLGTQFEDSLLHWIEKPKSMAAVFWSIVGLLATDLLLPIPSSAVSTFAGSALGAWWGTLATFLGMTLGAILGFSICQTAGPAVVSRLANPQDVARLESLMQRWGMMLVILTRPLPLLAEAAVVVAGAFRMRWSLFLMAATVSNFVIALLYAGLGHLARQHHQTGLVLVLSVVVPLGLTFFLRRLLPSSSTDADGEAQLNP